MSAGDLLFNAIARDDGGAIPSMGLDAIGETVIAGTWKQAHYSEAAKADRFLGKRLLQDAIRLRKLIPKDRGRACRFA